MAGCLSRMDSRVRAITVELMSMARLTLSSPLMARRVRAGDLENDLFDAFRGILSTFSISNRYGIGIKTDRQDEARNTVIPHTGANRPPWLHFFRRRNSFLDDCPRNSIMSDGLTWVV